jgi:hypothetical protein
MINIVVFSKDRPMQLDLFLRSFSRFVIDLYKYSIKVLYTYSNNEFKKGYDILIENKLSNVVFIKETNFKQNLIKLIDINNIYTVFFVDDIVFKEPFAFFNNEMNLFGSNPAIACLSLRLHPHLTYCYAEGRSIRQPQFNKHNIFDWLKGEGDYGYPMSVDGHIFKTEQIYAFIVGLDYDTPNSFEGKLHKNRKKMPQLMICYEKSKIINNPINRVQSVSLNRHGNISAETLNDKFLDGYIIDLTPFIGMNNIAVHTEVTPIFIKP